MADRINAAVFAVTLLLFGAPAGAESAAESSTSCADNQNAILLCEFVSSVESYSADFTQLLTDETGETFEESEGRLWMQRPGRFRWSYATPWERLIIANDTEVWLYDAELEQVTLRSADEAIEQTPAGLLAGNVASLDNYAITTVTGTDGRSVATLIPKSTSSDFREVVLTFTDEQLVELSLQDRFGQLTIIKLMNIERNPSIDDGLFSFVVPEGADLIDQRNN